MRNFDHFECRYMFHEGVSESILVSGESGAGKIESTKNLMHYILSDSHEASQDYHLNT